MGMLMKIMITLLLLAVLLLPTVLLSPQSTVFANSHEEESGDGMEMDDGSGDTMGMNDGPSMGQMKMGVTNTWQDQVNKISYPLTAVFALLAVWVCFLLMKATGMVDKFGLISVGLALFLVQAVFGVLFYMSNGTIITMPTLMFVMSLFNSVALLLIGSAFYRWKRMIR